MSKQTPKPPRPGRPRSEAAGSHAAIMDAVHALLQETSVRELSMEAVAKRAGVGKPTLYKWWRSKAALVLAMFQERLAGEPKTSPAASVEATLRANVRRLIAEFQGLFGKVMAELVAEGQSDPEILRELYQQHIMPRRSATIAAIERAKAQGEFRADVDAALLVDAIIGPIYYRMLLKFEPLTRDFGDRLIDQVLRGLRS